MIKAGIIGAAGYTAGELIRILIQHPEVTISYAHSNSNAGNPVSDVHKDLLGETNLIFTQDISYKVDVLFLCMGHGKSVEFLSKNDVPNSVKIIDLSTDFRHKANAKHNGRTFIYGLPELNKTAIQKAKNIANPGCFATCLQLGLLPLAAAGLLQDDIHINAITGSTGAGQSPSATSHFSWRNNNISIYKAFNHQHLKEITESVTQLQNNFDKAINFLPVRGNFTRGIFASIYTNTSIPLEEIQAIYSDFYEDAPFIHITDRSISLKEVVNSNKGVISIEKHGEKVLITSIIDNLLKGASGQAVQNMNLIFGLPETMSLGLKTVSF